MQVTKKQEVFEARQVTLEEVTTKDDQGNESVGEVEVNTREGAKYAKPGDWIVTDPSGHSEPYADADFRAAFEGPDLAKDDVSEKKKSK